jgi:hypothetical protein
MCGLVRRRGLEPLCLAALAPQAEQGVSYAFVTTYVIDLVEVGVSPSIAVYPTVVTEMVTVPLQTSFAVA